MIKIKQAVCRGKFLTVNVENLFINKTHLFSFNKLKILSKKIRQKFHKIVRRKLFIKMFWFILK
jgi:hypothetical protein